MKALRNIINFIKENNICKRERKSYSNLVCWGLCTNPLSSFVLFLSAWLAQPLLLKTPTTLLFQLWSSEGLEGLRSGSREKWLLPIYLISPLLFQSIKFLLFFSPSSYCEQLVELFKRNVGVCSFKATSMKLSNPQLLPKWSLIIIITCETHLFHGCLGAYLQYFPLKHNGVGEL